MKKTILLSLLMSALAPLSVFPAGVRPAGLMCEYRTNPEGLDEMKPRLSWHGETAPDSTERGLRQSAFQVLVASDEAALAADKGDLWDSGKVASDRSVGIEYAGRPLQPLQSCFWKVRVWTTPDGAPSVWSEPARWSMALTDPAQWTAKWIGHQPAAETNHADYLSLDGASWVWGRDKVAPGENIPAGETCHLRRVFDLPADAAVKSADLLLSVDAEYSAFLNGQKATETYGHVWSWTRARKVDVAALLRPGRNAIAIRAKCEDESPAGLVARLRIALADGKTIIVDTDASWRFAPKAPKGWEAADFDDAAWKPAGVYGAFGVEPWGRQVVVPRPRTPAPLFRRAFTVSKPVRRAVLCMTGVGFYEPRLNGAKVGTQVLEPSQTKYDVRVLYRAFDVTKQIQPGANVLAAMLGNGWYNVRTVAVWNYDVAPWRGEPALIGQLRIDYADGTSETVATDASWRAAYGPALYDCIRSGETFDARAWPAGWDAPGFDDAKWDAAQVVAGPKGALSAAALPPSEVVRTIKPVAVKETSTGVFVFDLGQNIAGWARLKVKGPAGATVTLRYGERVEADGRLTQKPIDCHLRHGDFQTDRYTLSGASGGETWEPRFTYHGFQYVEVSGWPGTPTVDSLEGCVVHTAYPKTGSFECSSDLLNWIQRATEWSYAANFAQGYPMDCPHREKNGWTGDAHLAAEQAQYNFQNSAAYEKWIGDLRDEQRPDGNLPGIVPTSGWGYKWGNGPAWDSALTLIPWYLYRYQDDLRVLERSYDAMKRYVDFMTARAKGHLVTHGLGDWAPAKSVTPVVVTSSGYYYQGARIVADAARLLGKAEDAQRYGALADAIRQAYNALLYRGGGVYSNGTQTALACALHQGLAPEDQAPLVAKKLADAVDAANGHLDTGILGAKYLLHALSDNGYADRAWTIATQTTAPAWGDWRRRGATTLWEDWGDGASRNHIMYGDIGTWFHRTLAGIRLDDGSNAFRTFTVAPTPVGDLAWARAECLTMHGPIRSAWKKEGARFTLDVTVPFNTEATVVVPLARPDAKVTEGGRPAETAPGLTSVRRDASAVVFRAGAGRYGFSVE